MSAEYKLVRRPDPHKTDVKQPLYPCFVPSGIVRLDDLARMARGRSSFSSADIKGMLQLLQDLIVDALEYGQCIIVGLAECVSEAAGMDEIILEADV